MQPVEHRALAPQHLALRPIVSNGLPVEIAQFFLGGHPPFAPLSSDSVWTYIHPAFPEGAEETGVHPVVVSSRPLVRVLSVTAYGGDTSPKGRGKWIVQVKKRLSNLHPSSWLPLWGSCQPQAD